jgi:hypothetical protein
METKIRTYEEHTSDIRNYKLYILNSTALYDYNIRSYEQQRQFWKK